MIFQRLSTDKWKVIEFICFVWAMLNSALLHFSKSFLFVKLGECKVHLGYVVQLLSFSLVCFFKLLLCVSFMFQFCLFILFSLLLHLFVHGGDMHLKHLLVRNRFIKEDSLPKLHFFDCPLLQLWCFVIVLPNISYAPKTSLFKLRIWVWSMNVSSSFTNYCWLLQCKARCDNWNLTLSVWCNR